MVVFPKDPYICSPMQTKLVDLFCLLPNQKHHGMWRSSVACLHGVQEVAGSNPVIPTKVTEFQWLFLFSEICFPRSILLYVQLS
jgi:hypothetical protein